MIEVFDTNNLLQSKISEFIAENNRKIDQMAMNFMYENCLSLEEFKKEYRVVIQSSAPEIYNCADGGIKATLRCNAAVEEIDPTRKVKFILTGPKTITGDFALMYDTIRRRLEDSYSGAYDNNGRYYDTRSVKKIIVSEALFHDLRKYINDRSISAWHVSADGEITFMGVPVRAKKAIPYYEYSLCVRD